MKTVERVTDLRERLDAARAAGQSVGFVPTMGYFHEGHRSLMRAARRDNDVVVVSIFVNPLQFGAGEDLDRYPRDPEGDATAAAAEGADLLFVPSVAEMYGDRCLTTIHVEGLTDGLCGRARPTHFDGVATVVAKLFSIVGPCRAYFGKKDFQQLAVVRRLTADLSLPVEVVGCPLVREGDGLAMSSRNAYLDPAQRSAATVLSRALRAALARVEQGERDAARLRELLVSAVAEGAGVQLDYAEVVGARDLAPIERVDGEVLMAVAAQVGPSRLIDNISLCVEGSSVTADTGVMAVGAGPGVEPLTA